MSKFILIQFVMMTLSRIIPFLLLLLTVSIPSLAQDHLVDIGLQNFDVNALAPEATKDWGRLVGQWDIVFESVDSLGNVQQSFEGEWNWIYILNGHAIQDVFILPPRDQVQNPNNLFFGTGIRIYNESMKKWESVWVDTSNKTLEMRDAYSTQDEIVLHQTSLQGQKLRITYFDMTESSFEWKQEIFDEVNQKWVTNQLIHAVKSD